MEKCVVALLTAMSSIAVIYEAEKLIFAVINKRIEVKQDCHGWGIVVVD